LSRRVNRKKDENQENEEIKKIKYNKKKIKNSVNGWDEKLNLEVFSRV